MICLIEVFLGIYLTFTVFRDEPIAGISVCSIFGFLAYLLLRKRTEKLPPEEHLVLETSPKIQRDSEAKKSDTNIEAENTIYPAENTLATKQLKVALSSLDNSLNELNKALSSGNILKVTVSQSANTLPSLQQKKEVSYINDGSMIFRTDGKKISDEEVPYLIQLGRGQASANLQIPDLTRIITESYQIMRTTDNPETLCSRYKVIIKKVNELATLEQQGLFDTNTFNHYNTLISDDNFYNLILSCYQKYASKAHSELKTQNGINNRINKFWKIICNNVSPEFYNSKLQK